MGKAEQLEEREVLESIFPDEIQDISESEYQLSIYLDADNSDDSESRYLQIILHVKYPPDYPDVPPILDIHRPTNATQNKFFNITEDSKYLLNSLIETIDENIGMAMIFTIVSILKENAEQLISSRQQAWQEEQEKALMDAEREENKKFHGTPVTSETFASWRDGFIKEMCEIKRKEEELEELAERKKSKGKEHVSVLTGKQLWMRGMVGKLDEEDGMYIEATS
ncbi:Protein GIR2 [Golovinomyces cichoracearum]|uniref:Protein GIR2 n=1 Tax=Golovinomyces cichoracearum TaxID=62708 RepID=A0A420H7T7_9PEZI|nr:Protein GIR2 [Golovinomyces cichoracearum]